MTMNTYRESAKIYDFPTARRTVVRNTRSDSGSVVDLAPQRIPKVSFGSGWYHDAAIQEAERKQ